MTFNADSLPLEVVHNIIEHLTCPRSNVDLFHCALVNKTWSREALRFLWVKAPPLETLVRLQSQDCLGSNVSFIRHADVVHFCSNTDSVDHCPTHEGIKNLYSADILLDMMNVIALTVSAGQFLPFESLLQPSLRILNVCWDGEYPLNLESHHILDSVEARCPLLQAFALSNIAVDTDRATAFLNKMKDLAWFEGRVTPCLPTEPQHASPGTMKLEYLGLTGAELGVPASRQRGPSHTFLRGPLQALRLLEFTNLAGLYDVLPRAAGLEALILTWLPDLSSRDLADALVHCPGLRELTVCGSRHVDMSDLKAIGQRCRRLRLLKWTTSATFDLASTALHFSDVARALPNIEVLWLPFQIPAEQFFNKSTAQAMHGLFECLLKGLKFDSFLSQECNWRIDDVQFPELVHLDAQQIDLFTSRETGIDNRQVISARLKQFMPRLTSFAYESVDDIQRAAMTVFEGLLVDGTDAATAALQKTAAGSNDRRYESVGERMERRIYESAFRTAPLDRYTGILLPDCGPEDY